ncbi:unnamed protein product [Gongylonema pulchrum]|uniref:Ntox16 domain-containing protein n=1 Tax=Gongylonema pulchrum TaxID=637853 RepID=A0A183DRA0_9BILA|nr:unnamed protein product [Gongylonema pulchrum]
MTNNKWTTNSTVSTSALAKFVEPCNNLWKNRMKTVANTPNTEILHAERWPDRGAQVIKELNGCEEELSAQQNKCASFYSCISKITAVGRDEWILGKQAWTVL